MQVNDNFEDQKIEAAPGDALHVDLGAYEGPLDVLLELARNQKVDLSQISILALADQYLIFVEAAKKINLELAADYLVMAAWLAYLKSRLLLPDPPPENEPTPEEMSAALQWQLQRLAAMQEAGQKLFSRARLGIDIFPRGEPEGLKIVNKAIYDVKLYDILTAYADFKKRTTTQTFTINPSELDSVDAALERLRARMGRTPNWESLSNYLPPNLKAGVVTASSVAATLVASLELAKAGELQIRQMQAFGPIYVRRNETNNDSTSTSN
jgi:segregation and condensation protein A